ncbi:MAG: Hypothetical protein BHV28_13710 [Candidatus Tokpelaia hoelldobleri]|uniref:Rap1a immunity protein domain-containing protein n=1 Tax=Candidatus Tokpelaia hoelldobleri TaxID=1902579 RepID=A0A1U9JW01_9HYPH|nr:MAG: Hypothetical protein BHV28_13710 [Candidatus Tokpelaia hoelldoblerii]
MNLRMFSVAFVMVFMSSHANAAGGYYLDGNRLHQYCQTEQGYVVGYTTGVVDALLLLTWYTEATEQKSSYQLCYPSNVLNTQLSDVVCKGLKDNPKDRHSPANILVYLYLSAAFPCTGQ